ncbi:BREX-1 system adenine-specific DNA-methyltransferase PglX [Alkalihalobacterium sp. APHAB7]|uniref:BREX-1 system adenine-specific DNA-methyltransferase PglX n=1 Tax=Alkalihalobacterium sp. APHAB7 TaxID=3402081 RepID=UPI003AAB3912
MNKSAIRKFAVQARTQLVIDIEQKAYELGITPGEIKEAEVFEGGFRVNQRIFPFFELKQREELIEKIKEKGYEQIIEEVAYTWFNRLIALRFMEVNDYLPTGVRVLSSEQPWKSEPDILAEAQNINLDINLDRLYRLQDANDREGLFKYLLIKQCNALHTILPIMFEKINDYTELLLPHNLLQDDSVLQLLVSLIPEEDWKDQVEIIGWLYQFYISEKKDEVFAGLKKKQKVTKENIPAATQLFTPKWIVQYMVENSVGRLWLDAQSNEELKGTWNYYIEETKQDAHVQAQLDSLKPTELKPEEIKVLDPCMGSGHILVYAFDVLYDIYVKAGYSPREIPKLILENNLYGLDIDDRAAQLAYFALMMKARSYNRRLFKDAIQVNVCSIQESNGIPSEAVDYFIDATNVEMDATIQIDLSHFIASFHDAKEYGSILKLENLQLTAVEQRLEEIRTNDSTNLFEAQYRDLILETIPPLLQQAKLLTRKYDVVITNPPYMGIGNMNPNVKRYIEKHYNEYSNDLFTVFMEQMHELGTNASYIATINQHSWMFLSSYERVRLFLMDTQSIVSMVHLGARAFEEIGGEVVQTTSYITRNTPIEDFTSCFINLVSFGTVEKEQELLDTDNWFIKKVEEFKGIPKYPFAYWTNKTMLENFKMYPSIDSVIDNVGSGNKTANNDRFLRFVWEVNQEDMNKRWFLYAKGGRLRKWYGNLETIIDWSDEAKAFYRENPTSNLLNQEYWFKDGITYTDLTTRAFNARVLSSDTLFDMAGPALLIENEDDRLYLLGLLNSVVANEVFKLLNSGLHVKLNDVVRVPFVSPPDDMKEQVIAIVRENIRMVKEDWDSFETSVDFKKHPFLLHNRSTLEETFTNWGNYKTAQFERLKANEEQLNEMFIQLYRLEGEYSSAVKEDELSIRIAERERDVKSFISFAVGCMFGRYSLDEEGLVFAGGTLKPSCYETFNAEKDNVIPITDEEYYDDDIITRFVNFLQVTFGEEQLEENLEWIANALNKKATESPRQAIRRYFIKDFYKDHLHFYKKRPIYWQFDSGKQNGFKALIYMHRYDEGLVARVRTEYLHLVQRNYEAELVRLNTFLSEDISAREKTIANKRIDTLEKQLIETQHYDQVIAHIANKCIMIDLSAGVKKNYMQFQNIKIVQADNKPGTRMNVLANVKF